VPKDATSLKITAYYKDQEGDQVSVEQQSVAFYTMSDFFVHVSTSTEQGLLGHYATIHLRSNFNFQDYSYVVSFYICLKMFN
jgi:hypothetical protein